VGKGKARETASNTLIHRRESSEGKRSPYEHISTRNRRLKGDYKGDATPNLPCSGRVITKGEGITSLITKIWEREKEDFGTRSKTENTGFTVRPGRRGRHNGKGERGKATGGGFRGRKKRRRGGGDYLSLNNEGGKASNRPFANNGVLGSLVKRKKTNKERRKVFHQKSS